MSKSAVEVTSLAVYLGFCPQLARFFMEFPSFGMMPVVYSNFVTQDGFPSRQPIQRIFLDTLASCDAGELTDRIFMYRGLFFCRTLGMSSFNILTREGIKPFHFDDHQISEAERVLSETMTKLFEGTLEFLPTSDIEKCRICFRKSDCPHGNVDG